MTRLRAGIEDYLALRRGLGFKLKRPGRFLREFAAWLADRGHAEITTQTALEWATSAQHLHPSEWAARLSSVRAFARYWSAIDPNNEIPPEGLLPFRAERAQPYLYTDIEIERLMEAARGMQAQFSLQPLTYYCLLGLLSVSGLRISEALNLRLQDVRWEDALLLIRTSKFGKSRVVPLHATTKDALKDYAAHRNHCFPDHADAHFFCSRTGRRLDEGQVRRIFYRLSRQIGIRGASASRGPRLHDFRHRADSPIMPICCAEAVQEALEAY
ncbi:MAG: tyrosine-type recombinase/integrase [Bryobacteraceae bacterium]